MADLPGYISDTELYYDEDGITGAFVAGQSGTVTATLAVLFALSGDAETNAVANSFKVVAPGGIVLDGPVTVGGDPPVTDISAALDALGT